MITILSYMKALKKVGLCLIPMVWVVLSPNPLSAEMLQLSQFQTSIFHISPEHISIPSDRFKDDNAIDDEQAEEFQKASEVKIYLPADHDNYPYSLIDYFTLDTDLVVSYSGYHDSILFTYPSAMFLSRHNISRTQYTNEKLPPEVYITAVTAHEPFYHQRVKAMSMTFHNYHVHQDESFTRSASPGEENLYTGQMINGDVYSSGRKAVWVRDFDPRLQSSDSTKSEKAE